MYRRIASQCDPLEVNNYHTITRLPLHINKVDNNHITAA